MSDTIRRYYILIKMDKDEAFEWDNKVAEIVNRLPKHGSLTQSYNQIFQKGIETYEAEAGEETEPGQDKKVNQKIKEVELEQARKRKMERLYSQMGFDDFVSWCEEEEVDWKTFLEEYDISKQGILKWSEKAVLWLRHFLRDEEATRTATIRTAAVESDLIDKSEKDWTKLRVLASRNRFTTSDKSWWKLP